MSNPYPALGETTQIRLPTAPDASVQRVLLRTVLDGEQHRNDATAANRRLPSMEQGGMIWRTVVNKD